MLFLPSRPAAETLYAGGRGDDLPGEGGARQGAIRPVRDGSDFGVRRAVATDIPGLVDMLVRAFEDDPIASYAFSGPRHVRRALRRLFSIQFRYEYVPHGEVYTTDGLLGAAMWTPSIRMRPSWQNLVHLLPLVPCVQGRHAVDLLRLLGRLDDARPAGAHWYLGSLGTEPGYQGCGVASALLAPVLSALDRAGMPAYLESSREENVDFYARRGFEAVGEIVVPGGGPTLSLMWRRPRPGGVSG